MKITPKPIVNADKINKARDMSGLRKWSRESKFMGTIMFLLGWFVIPGEVYLRRDFGRRWFTPMNFYAGAFLLVVIGLLQYLSDKIQYWVTHFQSTWNPFYTENTASIPYYDGTYVMLSYTTLYVILGLYHLFKIWWRSRTDSELHSYDDGTSWLEPVGGFLMKVINVLALPFIYGYARTRSYDAKKPATTPKLINDRTAFVNTVIEPLVFLWAAHSYARGFVSFWLYMTAFSTAIHASWKETAKKSKVLDFKDRMMEAQVMAGIKEGIMGKAVVPAGKTQKEKAAVNPVRQPAVTYPDLATIIEELHGDNKRVLGNV